MTGSSSSGNSWLPQLFAKHAYKDLHSISAPPVCVNDILGA